MNLPIRARLTLWYVAVLAITLLLLAGGVLAFVAREERVAVDAALRDQASQFAAAFAAEAREESSAVAAAEVTGHFARRDGAIFVYERPRRLMARAPATAPEVPIGSPFPPRSTLLTIGGSRCIVAPIDSTHVLVATQSLAPQRRAVAELRRALLLFVPAMLLLAAAGGYLLARRSLAPVSRMTADASRIEAERLSDRITIDNTGDEIGRLGAVLNALLARLERSFAQQRQLVADTSHELRTPVAVIRSEAEVALSRERTPAEYRDALDVIQSESVHLTRLIEDMLLMARADARAFEFPLRDVVETAARAMRTLAAAKSVDLTSTTDGAMTMRGDPELIRRMVLNLLDNAVKFTPAGGAVTVTTHAVDGRYVIAVRDTGPGIPADAQPHVFDRFYRADRARTPGSGSGLGLAIARSIAELHGGEIRLAHSDETGSIFEVSLPFTER
ncbi:MAG: ATP-binding protein [Acidobacteriota bacterium]